jgi:transcriptional regulator with XRE-family HTH domain
MKDLLDTPGHRIAAARRKAGFTQDEVAAAAGVHQKTVSRWENDHQLPEGEQLDRLAHHLHLTRSYILRGVEDAAAFHRGLSAAARIAQQSIHAKTLAFQVEAIESGAPEADLVHIRTALAVHEEAVQRYFSMPDLNPNELTTVTDAVTAVLRRWLANRMEAAGIRPGVRANESAVTDST